MSANVDAYAPISCMAHERLEFAVLRRQRLSLHFLDGHGAEQTLVVLPTDVYTRDGAEWLTCRTDAGQTQVIRLDRILVADTLT